MEINEQTVQQILAGIKDLQNSMFELKQEVRDNSDRLDRLEKRQSQFEWKMIDRFKSFDEKLDNLEAGQTTLKGQVSNLQLSIDTVRDDQDVLSEAYLRLKRRQDRWENLNPPTNPPN